MNTPLLHAWAARWQALRHRLPAGRTLVIGLPYGWLWLFFLLPFLFVLQISFSEVEIASPPYRTLISQSEDVLNIALNLGNYRFIFDDPLYLDAYLGSVKVALVTTLFCLLLGYPMAYAIARAAPTQRNTLLMLVMLPFWTSFLLRVYAWKGLLADQGVVNNLLLWLGVINEPIAMLYTDVSMLVGMTYVYCPFMILPLYATLVKMDFRLLEAANDLGASPWTGFWLITVPLSKAGIIAGSMLVFIPCVGEFVIPSLLGGAENIMIGRVVWDEMFSSNNWPRAAALAILMILFILVPMAIYNHYGAERRAEEE